MTDAPIVAFKDLCLDAVDAERSAEFWAAALGLRVGERRGAVVRLDGPSPRDTVWVNAVPEPKAAKNRLHLDVHTGSVAELEALGAAVLDDTLPWTVMADPDGGEFCAFVRAEPPARRLYELVLDAQEPAVVAAWWAGLIGGCLESAADGVWSVGGVPGAPFEWLCVSPTADRKAIKNRVHLDVTADDPEQVLAHGARLLRPRGGDISWHVMADPEGNEFCVFTP